MNDFYPVRRRGEPRRLNPDWAAIDWLEAGIAQDTETVATRPLGCTDGELYITYAAGARWKRYNRPMFQPLPLEASSSLPQQTRKPCAACYDFHRTWACEDHPELAYNAKHKQWKLPPQPTEYDRLTAEYRRLLAEQGDAYTWDSYEPHREWVTVETPNVEDIVQIRVAGQSRER